MQRLQEHQRQQQMANRAAGQPGLMHGQQQMGGGNVSLVSRLQAPSSSASNNIIQIQSQHPQQQSMQQQHQRTPMQIDPSRDSQQETDTQRSAQEELSRFADTL